MESVKIFLILLEQVGEDEETVATIKMYSEMGRAYLRQREYADADKYFARIGAATKTVSF